MERVPVILGPTASGKTSVGIELAKHINGEIISVDSRKVYKGLPIGTATPAGTWENNAYYVNDVAHYLMGHLSPDAAYTAGDFAKDADRLIKEIRSKRKVPILVGGTGFYFKSLQHGLPELPNRDEALRAKMNQEIETHGIIHLHDQLAHVDPASAKTISNKDRHKIIRALEVFKLTDVPFSTFQSKKKKKTNFDFVVMGLDFPKEILEHRIEVRSKKMVERGMIEETEALLKQGFDASCPALTSFGFKEAVQVVTGNLPRKEFLTHLIKGTKAYSKRQRTWFRTQVQPTWFNCDASSTAKQIALKMRGFLIPPN